MISFVLLYEKMQLVKLLTKTSFSSAGKVAQYNEKKRESLSSASTVALFGGSLSVISPWGELIAPCPVLDDEVWSYVSHTAQNVRCCTLARCRSNTLVEAPSGPWTDLLYCVIQWLSPYVLFSDKMSVKEININVNVSDFGNNELWVD